MAAASKNLGGVKDFVFRKFLGKGTYGSVYLAFRTSDKLSYAIKKVDTRRMTMKERAEAVNEIRILASVTGPHVIKFLEAFVEDDIVYMVTEFADGGDLFNKLRKLKKESMKLPEQKIWSYLIQMTLGLSTLHAKNIVHRDLKSANVFIMSGDYLKLGDFGVSKVLKSEHALAHTQVGTPYYVAPEVWKNRPYNSKCDMWSLGCLLYELITHRPPFEASSMEGLARRVTKGKYEDLPPQYSDDLATIVALLLVVNPAKRASTVQILKHPAVQSRMDMLPSFPTNATAEDVDLMQTIHVPRKFDDLTKNLPRPRYAPSDVSESTDVTSLQVAKAMDHSRRHHRQVEAMTPLGEQKESNVQQQKLPMLPHIVAQPILSSRGSRYRQQRRIRAPPPSSNLKLPEVYSQPVSPGRHRPTPMRGRYPYSEGGYPTNNQRGYVTPSQYNQYNLGPKLSIFKASDQPIRTPLKHRAPSNIYGMPVQTRYDAVIASGAAPGSSNLPAWRY